MGIDWGDAPGVVGAVAGVGAVVVSFLARRDSKRSARAAVRQAAAAERQVELMEQGLEAAAEAATAYDRKALEEARNALAGPPSLAPAWWIDRKSKNTYVLRNIGTGPASKVEIDASRIACPFRGDTTADEVAKGASMTLTLIPAWGAPKPNELWVRWEDHPDWMAVPVP